MLDATEWRHLRALLELAGRHGITAHQLAAESVIALHPVELIIAGRLQPTLEEAHRLCTALAHISPPTEGST